MTWERIGPHALWAGEALDALRALPDASVDALVTDPPYGIAFMGKRWDYDLPGADVWAEVLRVLKPGAHLAVFASTRTQHRMAAALEDAGAEIRDLIAWTYATGMPKNHNVPAAIDRAMGAKPEPLPPEEQNPLCQYVSRGEVCRGHGPNLYGRGVHGLKTRPGSPEARAAAWAGTALRPWMEPVTLARKPLEDTIAGTFLEHGTGAINVRDTRGEGDADRWPGNLITDGSAEALEPFGDAARFLHTRKPHRREREAGLGALPVLDGRDLVGRDPDSVGARNGRAGAGRGGGRRNRHPTVKPVDLIRWLVRLVTPPGGVVLDPFVGSGTTAIAAGLEGVACLGVERDPDYLPITRQRIRAWTQGLAVAQAVTGRPNPTTPEVLSWIP